MHCVIMLLFFKCLFLFVSENQCKMNETVYEVAVTGNTGCYGDRVNSRITLPVDLSEGVGKVQVIHEDTDLSGFQNNVLTLVENEKKVLVIVYASSKVACPQ